DYYCYSTHTSGNHCIF
nr:immunoglobulin light chain junction region [Macaca mulatta]